MEIWRVILNHCFNQASFGFADFSGFSTSHETLRRLTLPRNTFTTNEIEIALPKLSIWLDSGSKALVSSPSVTQKHNTSLKKMVIAQEQI